MKKDYSYSVLLNQLDENLASDVSTRYSGRPQGIKLSVLIMYSYMYMYVQHDVYNCMFIMYLHVHVCVYTCTCTCMFLSIYLCRSRVSRRSYLLPHWSTVRSFQF